VAAPVRMMLVGLRVLVLGNVSGVVGMLLGFVFVSVPGLRFQPCSPAQMCMYENPVQVGNRYRLVKLGWEVVLLGRVLVKAGSSISRPRYCACVPFPDVHPDDETSPLAYGLLTIPG
jgi:hypothetical protein